MTTFVRVLRKTFHDPRVRIYGDSAENVKDILAREGEPEADYILSGIPFSFFSDALRDRIVSRTHDVLRPGGKFLPYQTFFQKNEHLLDYLTRYFSEVRDEFFFYNVPPMRIYEAVK